MQSKRFSAVVWLALAVWTMAAPAYARQSATLSVTVHVADPHAPRQTLGPQRTLRCIESSPGVYQCEANRPAPERPIPASDGASVPQRLSE